MNVLHYLSHVVNTKHFVKNILAGTISINPPKNFWTRTKMLFQQKLQKFDHKNSTKCCGMIHLCLPSVMSAQCDSTVKIFESNLFNLKYFYHPAVYFRYLYPMPCQAVCVLWLSLHILALQRFQRMALTLLIWSNLQIGCVCRNL